MENLQLWNGRSIIPQAPKHALYVDASDRGWGAHWRNKRISGLWSREEAQQPINWRELKAVELALQTFRSLRQTSIRIRTDYVTSLTYINRQRRNSLDSLVRPSLIPLENVSPANSN